MAIQSAKVRQSVFDIHTHLYIIPGLDPEVMEFARDWDMPLAISCLGPDGNSLVSPTLDECQRANDMVIDLANSNPGLVYGYCYANPLLGKEMINEIRRCLASETMYGIKLWIACHYNDPMVYPVVEEAISHNVPILQHTWSRIGGNLPGESNPDDVRELALRYPQAKIILAHMGFHWKRGVDAVKDCPNVYVDTCGFDPEMGCIEYAVSNLGADRVLYGSDAPIRDVLCQIGKIVSARISEEDMDKVLNLNARRLLGLDA